MEDIGVELTASGGPLLLAQLCSLDVGGLDVAGTTEVVGSWQTLIGSCQARMAETIAHLTRLHGGETPAHDGPDPEDPKRCWEKTVLAARLGIGEGPATTLVHTSVALTETLPGLAAALECGGVGWQHCVNVAREVEGLSAEQCGAVERAILTDRRRVTAYQFGLRAKALAAELLPATEPAAEPARSLRASNAGDGGVEIAVSLTADGGGPWPRRSTHSPAGAAPVMTGRSMSGARMRWWRCVSGRWPARRAAVRRCT